MSETCLIIDCRDKTTKKNNKRFMSLKVNSSDRGEVWMSCWDSKYFEGIHQAHVDGSTLDIDVDVSDKTNDQGEPYLNVGNIASLNDGAPAPTSQPAKPAAAKSAAKPPAGNPPGPSPTPPGPGPSPVAVAGSAQTSRAIVCLSAAMLAWGGAIARNEADVCRWIARLEKYVVEGTHPQAGS